MFKQSKLIIPDPNGIVSKLIFEDENSIAETVVYKYQDRGVICFSVQSGCPVGCTFCGTGNRFIRNLTSDEMILQIESGLKMLKEQTKIQIMSMSMGEPMLNFNELMPVITKYLNRDYYFFVSTVGIKNDDVFNDILNIGRKYKKFGLQFSLHCCNEEKRRALFRNKTLPFMNLNDLVEYGNKYFIVSGNLPYYNYIATKNYKEDLPFILNMANSHITCSVMCNINEKKNGSTNLALEMADILIRNGFDCSVFNPAGQDTIGGGCGQLFYVQQKMRKMERSK